MCVITDVADAVVATLNAGDFSEPFEARRCYLPLLELPALKDLHVSVVPRGVTVANIGRGVNQHEVQVDVAVQKRVGEEATEELDALMGLVEEIADEFSRTPRLASYPGAVRTNVENTPIYAQEHLAEMRLFTSVLTLTFRVAR